METTFFPAIVPCTTHLLDPEALNRAQTFEDLLGYAIKALAQINNHALLTGMAVVQICGPMSTGGKGSLAANMAYFRKAVAYAKSQGILVFDQSPFEDAMVRLAAPYTA